MHLVVVIPAYNEAQVIGEVVRSLPKRLRGISRITPLVIDDNSTDETQTVAEANGALCIRHELNLGAGGATATGLEAAKLLDADIVVTMDADGQHNAEDMTKLITPIIDQKMDVVIGSRLMNTEGMPFYKVVGNNLLNIVTYVFCGLWVSDSQSGYKAFSKKALHDIQLYAKGYEFSSEIISEIKRHHLKFTETAVQVIYTEYSKRKGQLALNAINIVVGLLTRKIR